MGLHTFMDLIIWNTCGNDNMENLDCLRPFPRLDYDVRGERSGAADWPTPANSCYAHCSSSPELLFAQTLLCVTCTTFYLLRVFCN